MSRSQNPQALPAREPIAIIGMSCRFPGAPDLESFWQVMAEGRETVRDYPGGRMAYLDAMYAPNSPYGQRIACRKGGFLDDVDRFDALFFGISPREATYLDPQFRLLHETSWEALEDAGLVREQLAGSRTGVFIGVWTSDYEDCMYEATPDVDFYATTGGGRYPASGRLSYFLDLRGPNLTLDTACSSSLVAVHLACQSLWTGESELAIAGGVNVILRPEVSVIYSGAGMLSPEGRCRFGDAGANGYVRSEGCGVVVLKPLSLALADGDHIHAVVRGTAVTHGGQSSGRLTAPGVLGQQQVIEAALRSAGVTADQIDYVEAHGTGTLVGDPVELEALGRAMANRGASRPCAVGSVKTNIGHTESAAGMAGLIKVALSFQHGTIPASLHFEQPNPRVPWDALPVRIQSAAGPWPERGRPPLAGVSGFGITGTNAHVVLEAAPAPQPAQHSAPGARLIALSAQSPEALTALAQSWREKLPAFPALEDAAYTAAKRRTHHDHRLAVTARDYAELDEGLRAWLAGDSLPGVAVGARVSAPRTVFVFPGQGGQWLGMGRKLMRDEPVFREAMEACDRAIAGHAGWSVIEKLLAVGEESLAAIDVVQPALFAMMVALAELWRSWGVQPEAVVGHSMGEAAAAAVAGALTLEDAAAVICHRSRLMKRASGKGLMAVAQLDAGAARELLRSYDGRVSVAACNSPDSTVFSGDADAVEELVAALEGREVFCRRIKVDVASHCAHMDAFGGELGEALAGVRPRAGSVPFYSTTTGQICDGRELDSAYWVRNLRQPVLFSDAIQRLLADSFTAFVEINAHPVLVQAIEAGIRHADRRAIAVASLRRDQDERGELLHAAGALHVHGCALNFDRINGPGAVVRLPQYPWQRERYWLDGSASKQPSPRQASSGSKAMEHLYEMQWQPATFAPTRAAGPAAAWLLVADRIGIAERLAGELKVLGQECLIVRDDAAFDTACASGRWSVVHLRSAGATAVWSLESIWRAQQEGCFHAASALKKLTQSGAAVARFWVVTTGAAGPGPQATFPHGPLWGLGSVAAREHPELRWSNVDIGATPGETEIKALAKLLCADTEEDQLAIRGAECYRGRWERAEDAGAAQPAFSAEATYLITGATGGIAVEVARWMVERGARHLAMVARHEPSGEWREKMAALEAAGAAVRFCPADVTDPEAVLNVIRAVGENMPPLKGVLHLAVAAEGALLCEAGEDHFRRVMAPKMAGAWNLHSATQTLSLDFFVLFSSIAAVLSQPGQGSYAAANAFLDALARHRRHIGLPAVSLNWGPWTAVGLAGREGPQRSVRAYAGQGIEALPLAAALDALGLALSHPSPGLLIAVADWTRFRNSYEGGRVPCAFRALAPEAPVAEAVPAIREKLLASPVGRERVLVLETYLTEQLAYVLKLPPARLDAEKPMGTMGVDSLLALEFVRRLSASTSVRLPATAVFNFPTLRKLGAELARRMEIPLETAGAAPAEKPAPARVDTGTLSEEDAIHALMGRQKGD